jgi:hypothetical protein
MSPRRDVLRNMRGVVTDAIWHFMIQHNGRLRSSRWLPSRLKDAFANRWAIAERSEVALTVASMYSGGDYFEFGSESFTTLMNFLTAFDLNSRTPASSPLMCSAISIPARGCRSRTAGITSSIVAMLDIRKMNAAYADTIHLPTVASW